MNEETRRAYLSVINKWLMGEKKYGLESRSVIGEDKMPNGELQFSFKTKIDDPNSTNKVERTDCFRTNSYFGNLDANLEQLSTFLDSLSYEAYEEMDELNN